MNQTSQGRQKEPTDTVEHASAKVQRAVRNAGQRMLWRVGHLRSDEVRGEARASTLEPALLVFVCISYQLKERPFLSQRSS